MQRIIIPSFISLLTVLLAPILVPAMYITKRLKQSRITHQVSHRDCSNCGNHLGVDSATRAAEHFKNMVQEFKNKYPSMRVSFGRPFAAICTHCDCHYDYDPVEKTIVPKPILA